MRQLTHPDDAVLLVGEETIEGGLYGVAGGTAAIFNARSPAKTSANEDSAAIIPYDARSAIVAVADGVGGERAGRLASNIVVRSLWDSIAEAVSNDVILRSAVLNGIETANRAILEYGIGAASTLALIEISDREVRPYHIGDSMILVVGQRARIKMQTVAHSPVALAQESGLLSEHEALHHNQRHVVLNVVGSSDMRTEIGTHMQLAQRDTAIVASDGLGDNLTAGEIAAAIRKGPLATVANRLPSRATSRMTSPEPGAPSKCDDLSFVIYRPNPDRGIRRKS